MPGSLPRHDSPIQLGFSILPVTFYHLKRLSNKPNSNPDYFRGKFAMPHSDQSTQRVLIFGESIFEEGIANLLTDGVDLQVSSAKYTDDLAFLDEIEQKWPDVIVLNESIPRNTVRILKLLFSIPSLAGLRVVIIRLSDNMIDVYEMPKQTAAKNEYEPQQINVTKRDDLVAAVRGE